MRKSVLCRYILLALSLLAFFALPVFIYRYCYGLGPLYDGDNLMAEEFFLDIFRHKGALAQWSLPVSSYWADLGLYSLVRSLTDSVQKAMALYAAVQGMLLSLAAFFALWPLLEQRAHKSAAFLGGSATALLVCAGGPYSVYMCRVLFHILTIISVFICLGCYLRLLRNADAFWVYALLVITSAQAAASDTMFVLWFTLPAAGFTGLLWLSKRISFHKAAALWAWLFLPVLAGKLLDAVFKPESSQTANHVKPALRRILPTLRQLLSKSMLFFTSSLPVLAAGLSGLLLFVTLSFRKNTAGFMALLAIIIGTTFMAYAVNGVSTEWYMVSFWSMILLLLLPLLAAVLSPAVSSGVFLLLFLGVSASVYDKLHTPLEEFRPSYSPCVVSAVEGAGSDTILAPYTYARMLHYLSGSAITVTPIYYNYFIPSLILSTRNAKAMEAQWIIMPDRHPGSFSPETVLALNGEPERKVMCPEQGISLWYYPQKARLGSMRDYLLDQGRFEKSRPEKDMLLWQGERHILSTVPVLKISSLFRLDRQWIVVHMADSVQNLRDKEITVHMAGDKHNVIRQFAAQKMAANPEGFFTPLWKKILWSATFTLDETNLFAAPDGQGSWFFFRSPDRETRKWLMFALEADGKTVQFF